MCVCLLKQQRERHRVHVLVLAVVHHFSPYEHIPIYDFAFLFVQCWSY